MLNLSSLIAAPFAAFSFALPVRLKPAELWRDGQYLTPSEFSGLIEECTFYTLEATTEDGDRVFYIRCPGGERLDDGYPFEDLETVADFVGWRIDEALSAADRCQS